MCMCMCFKWCRVVCAVVTIGGVIVIAYLAITLSRQPSLVLRLL
jgi:hypothetical protein